MNNEEWKEIPNSSGMYWVSNYGNVKSLIGYKEKIFKKRKDNSGYLHITISSKKINFKINTTIHKLVYTTFIGDIPAGYSVHHVDFNKNNNYVENLIILTKEEHLIKHNKINRPTKDNKYEYQLEWRKRNPDRIKMYNKSWYERNKDYFKEKYKQLKQKVTNE